MLAKAITFVTLLAAAQAGGVYYDTHVGAQSEQTIRGLGFGASTYTSQSKAVDSAFSSVRRHESRLINPAVNVATYAHAAPVATYAHAAPVATYAHAAPVATYAHAAPVATYARAATPVATSTHVASGHGLGVAYSAVPQVAHLFFDGFGAHYEY